MAFKTVQEFENLVVFEKAGDDQVGEYKGVRKWFSDKHQKDFNVHTIITEDGEKQFFGAGGLDAQLKKAQKLSKELSQEKCVVKIHYLGMSAEPIKTAYGEKPLHQFDVHLDQ
jgi:hypothetical protein